MTIINKTTVLLCTLFSFVGFWSAACAQELQDPSLDKILEKVKNVYGINIHYTQGPLPKPANMNYQLADIQDKKILRKVILQFVQEIGLYPKNFFRSAQCQDIYFVQKLFYKQQPVDGIFSQGTNFIIYDYSRESENTQKIRHRIHHELYHMIGSRRLFWKTLNPTWESYNRPGFIYDIKYNPHGTNPKNIFAPAEPGFITHYAMASAEEDRAETFAGLMISQERRLLEQWAKNDEILFHKMKVMKQFIKEAF